MSICEKTDVCVFFTNRMNRLPTAQERMQYKVEYCVKDKERCARYMVNKKIRQGYHPVDESGMAEVDQQMREIFPDDIEKAEVIIKYLCNN
ncbi:MAG: hypothetical protein JSV21_09970 [Nitrospirota bacterium]|nr:MAG: hypothetical protein JSV21_09970 [Nitrospirota bacterium]